MTREKLDAWYDEDYFDTYPRHDRRIRQILGHLEMHPSDVVCEFGCGLGHILLAMADDIHAGIGIDGSDYAIASARAAAEKAAKSNLEFTSMDITSLTSKPDYQARFDKVLMMDISEHLYDDTLLEFLKTARFVLKPGGQLLLHTPNADYFLERMKARNFIVRQFESHIAVRNAEQHAPILSRAGFTDIRIEYLPHYNRLLGALDRILMRIPLINRFFRARILLAARADRVFEET